MGHPWNEIGSKLSHPKNSQKLGFVGWGSNFFCPADLTIRNSRNLTLYLFSPMVAIGAFVIHT